MNWDAIAAVGEIVGAGAVVVSLVYLAAQIRQNTAQVESQMRAQQVASTSSIHQTFSTFRSLIAGTPDNAALWAKGQSDLASLTDTERTRFDFLMMEMFWTFSMPWLFVEQGVLGEDYREVVKNTLRPYLGPGARAWWRASPHRSEYAQGFAAAVDELVEGASTNPLP